MCSSQDFAVRMEDACGQFSGSVIKRARLHLRLLPGTKFDPAYDQTGRGEVTMPLLCQEACNLLVAEARKVVKSRAE